ncbi:hypothetical protein D1823_11520 [Ruegeria sp. AD91A]|nr:hypothetical protein D1823_11520 [Ruegeria sp. AD91A]
MAILTACDASEEEVRTASTAAVAGSVAYEAEQEYEKSTDFDAIAEDAASGIDTSDFGALTD